VKNGINTFYVVIYLLAELFSSRDTTLEARRCKGIYMVLSKTSGIVIKGERKTLFFFYFFRFGDLECSLLAARWSFHHCMLQRSTPI